jgi:hypothetical protein
MYAQKSVGCRAPVFGGQARPAGLDRPALRCQARTPDSTLSPRFLSTFRK